MECSQPWPPKRRIWRKIHIGINDKTLECRAVEVTLNNVGYVLALPEFRTQIATNQDIESVIPDGAYGTGNCHDAITDVLLVCEKS